MKKSETLRANEGFEKINQLFDLEGKDAELSPKERYTQRQEHFKRVLDDFYACFETVNPSQGTALAIAVQYARNEKNYLYAFLEDPKIPIDNNLAERAIKTFVIGRKTGCFPPLQKELMPVRQPIQLSTQHRQTAFMSGNI